MKQLGLSDAPIVQERPVETPQIDNYKSSVLPANLCMPARDNRRGCIDNAFERLIAAKADHFFV
jgi:hypothetical protein